MKSDRRNEFDPRGKTPESWCYVDCGAAITNLAGNDIPVYRPEAYTVRNTVWKAAGMEQMGGCLCVGCLEKPAGACGRRTLHAIHSIQCRGPID